MLPEGFKIKLRENESSYSLNRLPGGWKLPSLENNFKWRSDPPLSEMF